jgi:hypothetical protein
MSTRFQSSGKGSSVLRVLAVTSSVMIGVIGLSTSASSAASVRPRASAHAAVAPPGSVHNFKNKLARTTNGWCDGGPTNAPCSGGSGDYGTIDIVSHNYSNSGGYAPSVPGPDGQGHYARVAGGQDGGVESVNGCSVPGGGENCSGPYTLFGSKNLGSDTIFPAHGFSTMIKIYLDTNWADVNPNQLIGWDTSLNDNTGAFLEDQTFDICSSSDSGGGYYITTSFGSGGCTPSATELTASGWYTFTQNFTESAGQVFDQFTILNSASAPVFTSNVELAGITSSNVGGPLYGWFPDEDVLGLPVAQISLTKNP